ENAGALRDRFWLRIETGDAQGALDDYGRFPATERSAEGVQRARAWAASKTGRDAEMIDSLTLALEKAPDDVELLAWRAGAFLSSRHLTEAESDLTRILALHPS